MEIDLDVVLLGRAAPRIDLNYTRHCEQPSLQHPILNRSQIGQTEVRRSNELIAIDLPDQARALNLRHDVIRKAHILLEVDGCLREREIVDDAILKHDVNKRETVERRRANDIDSGRRSKTHFDGDAE